MSEGLSSSLMEYERIEKKSQGGGFSPAKLRSMLLRVEKKRKDEQNDDKEELKSTLSLRSEDGGVEDDRGDVSTLEECKDVAVVVSDIPDCSTSSIGVNDRKYKEHSVTSSSRIRSQEDCDSGSDSAVSSAQNFEFQKADKPQGVSHRILAPFRQSAPSKWDDAQKWIASPTLTRQKSGQPQVQSGQTAARRSGFFSYGSRQNLTKIVVEVPDQKMVSSEEPDTKRIDSNQQFKRDAEGQKSVTWVTDQYPVPEPYLKSELIIASSTAEPEIALNQHDTNVAIHSVAAFAPPLSTVRSVSMRDMGTEMTPMASQEPSRNGTPVRATTPTRSPTSSQPSTPGRAAPLPSPVEPNKSELSDNEMKKKTRREIMALGNQLGKTSIAAWASKEDDVKNTPTSIKTGSEDQFSNNVMATRAAAWEEAEKTKYMARYKREEIKIQAWENHEIAKAEAERKKVEIKVERLRARAEEKQMNKIAESRNKAEEKRAKTETRRNCEVVKIEQQAEYIRITGRVPSSFSCCSSFRLCKWCS